MKKSVIWKLLLFIGLCPFLVPLLMSVTRMSMLTFIDWIILWSFIYWPTYIAGSALIILSIYKLIKK